MAADGTFNGDKYQWSRRSMSKVDNLFIAVRGNGAATKQASRIPAL